MVPRLLPTYPPLAAPWPPAVPTSAFGRGVAPARATPEGAGAVVPDAPIVVERVWAVPEGDGAAEALAIVSGTVGDRLVIEAIGVDDGRVRWREARWCQAPVVHVTAATVVCGDAIRMRGFSIEDGRLRWQQRVRFTGAEDGLLVGLVAGGGGVAVIDADSGEVVGEIAVPAGVRPEDVRAACPVPGGVELWAWGPLPAVSRFTVGAIAAGPVETMTLARPPARVSPCADPPLLELPIEGSLERELLALSRSPLAAIAGPVTERGFWRRGDGVVVATARGIERLDGALGRVEVLAEAEVGREIARRGARRLVRGAGGRPVLLEDDRPVAYLSAPVHVDSAALGATHVVGGGWQLPARTQADRIGRWRLPAPGGAPPAVPPLVPRPVPDPALASRDLPVERRGDDAPTIDLPGAGRHDVALLAIDPADPALLYTAPLDAHPDRARGAGLAALDLRARAWRWHAGDGCPAGTPVAVAVARDVIVCGAIGAMPGAGAVRAVDRADGAVRWTWHGATVDGVAAAGGIVVVAVGRVALVLDAATGAALGAIGADDGFAPRVVPVSLRGTDLVVAAERGAVVARLPRVGMLPVWAAAARGVVVALAPVGDRVAAELLDGELYLLDPGTGRAIAAGGWGRRWRALDGSDLVLAEPAVPAGAEWSVFAYGADGAPRLALGLEVAPPWLVAARARDPRAPLALAYGPAARALAVVDPRTGQVAARYTLPTRAVPGSAFATVVDGRPVVGAILAQPLGAVVF